MATPAMYGDAADVPRVADVYDRKVQVAVKRFLSILEHLLILGLAAMVARIVLSILAGVMGMTELVQ